MTRSKADSLLSIASFFLHLLIALLVLLLVAVGGITIVKLVFQRAEVVQEVADAGLAPMAYWGIFAASAGIALILGMAIRFNAELIAIIRSVELNDPFVAENADRILRMGWIATGIQLVQLPIRMNKDLLHKLTDQTYFELSGSSLNLELILTLFVLARVFRVGAEMRADLEGTV